MNVRTRIFFGVGVAALAVASLGWHWFGVQGPPRAEPEARPLASDHGVAAPVRADVPSSVAGRASAPASVVPAPIKEASLAHRLMDAKDWRAFALDARKHPELGGRFYALYVANQCGRDIKTIKQLAMDGQNQQLASSGTISPQRLAMTDSFTTRCAAFVPGEIDELMASIKAESVDGADPLLKAKTALLQGKQKMDGVAVRDAVQQMLATDDPLLLSSDNLLLLAMAFQEKQDGKRTLWFDGKEYDVFVPAEATAVRLATQLGVCSANDACALDDTIALSCMGRVDCITDRTEYVRVQYMQSPAASSDGFSNILNLAERVRGAIQRKDAGAFVRP